VLKKSYLWSLRFGSEGKPTLFIEENSRFAKIILKSLQKYGMEAIFIRREPYEEEAVKPT
jgi:hypothetical protein